MENQLMLIDTPQKGHPRLCLKSNRAGVGKNP